MLSGMMVGMFDTVFDTLDFVIGALKIILIWSPIWLPFVLGKLWLEAWLNYRRTLFISKKKPVVLEIRVPKEINKSPLAMEVSLNAFYSTGGEGTYKDIYWTGGVRAWFSLELVSIEGQVKFFIWTWKDNMKAIQNAIYGQYPTVEIVEVPDYTRAFLYDTDKAEVYAAEFELAKADPYPIKTYVDYGLDRDPKEEFKIDPITAVLEYLGGLGRGEQAWIQFVIRAHKGEDPKEGGLFAGIKAVEDLFEIIPKVQEQMATTDKWKDDVKAEVEKIIKKRKITGAGGEEDNKINLTTFEKDTITALERSISKLPFDVGIRALYLAERDVFNPAHKGALNGVLAQYGTQHLNGFKKAVGTGFDYWLEDPTGKKLPAMKKEMFEAYRDRGYFHHPYKNKYLHKDPMFKTWKRKWFVLNAEELATIFHFPGGVAQTPTFGRIDSRKAEPPVNLPM